MIKTSIAKYIGFPLQDIIRGTNILSTLKFLRKSQYWSDELMYNYRISRLKGLIDYAYRYVPYYRKLFNNNNILPADIRTFDDLSKIPILTKKIARENQKDLISTLPGQKNIKRGKTGGTTGVPLILLKDAVNRSFTWASYYRWYDWIEIKKEEKTLTLWGSKKVLSNSINSTLVPHITDWIQNNKTINSFNIGSHNISEVYSNITTYNPVFLKGYLSALILLARFMIDNNLSPNPSLRAISTTSESLLPQYRDLLEKVFAVPLYDQYGCGENSAVSYECQKHKGLHITQEHVHVECLDEYDKNVVGQKGRFIITSLNNYIMPFIRYENGDIGKLLKDKCNCGVNSPLMGSIDGRTIDTITLKDGSQVHGVFFTDIFHEIGITTETICRFQIYQYKSGKIDLLLESPVNLPDQLLSKLELVLSKFLKHFDIKFTKHIPVESSGKFLYIKKENR